jgi:uncharacterized protein (TIGR04222 family)
MDWFEHNFIADMPGPQFLLLYAGVILSVLVLCRVRLRLSDPSAALPALTIPAQPDPYTIAYLRGGTSEVVRLVTFALLERGFLQVVDEPKKKWQNQQPQRFQRVTHSQDLSQLSRMEHCALDWFDQSRTAADIFKESGGLISYVEGYCTEYERHLRKEQLLTSDTMKTLAAQTEWYGAAIILSVGGYKLLDAWLEGRSNVSFLIIMSIVSLVAVVLVCGQPRLSQRGRIYLRQLQLAFNGLKSQASRSGTANKGVQAHTTHSLNRNGAMGLNGSSRFNGSSDPKGGSTAALNPNLMLVVGVFGVTALSGTAFAYYPQLFPHASAGGGGSCGGGGGGGGCGGGCGGGGCGGG